MKHVAKDRVSFQMSLGAFIFLDTNLTLLAEANTTRPCYAVINTQLCFAVAIFWRSVFNQSIYFYIIYMGGGEKEC